MIIIEVILKNKEPHIDLAKALRNMGRNVKSTFLQDYQSGTKTGRRYGSHIASAPNETPARITGNLGNKFVVISRKTEVDFVDNSGYGAYLEFGTKRIAARKGVISAINNNLAKLNNELSENS